MRHALKWIRLTIMYWGIRALVVAVTLTGCGSSPKGDVFGATEETPQASAQEPDAGPPPGAGGASGAEDAGMPRAVSGRRTVEPDAGTSTTIGAGGQPIVVVGWVDAGSGGATMGTGGARGGSGGAPGAGGARVAAGGNPGAGGAGGVVGSGGAVAGAGGQPARGPCGAESDWIVCPPANIGNPNPTCCPRNNSSGCGSVGTCLPLNPPDKCGGCPHGTICSLNVSLDVWVCVQ